MLSISQVLVGSAPLKPYGFDKGCKHIYIHTEAGGGEAKGGEVRGN